MSTRTKGIFFCHLRGLIDWTGYKISFPFLENVEVVGEDGPQLYRHVVHPDYTGLFFVGLLQPLGPMIPLCEVQSKWIAEIIKVGVPNYETSASWGINRVGTNMFQLPGHGKLHDPGVTLGLSLLVCEDLEELTCENLEELT